MGSENALILGLMTALFLTLGYLGVPVAFSLIAGVLVGTAMTAVSVPTTGILQETFTSDVFTHTSAAGQKY